MTKTARSFAIGWVCIECGAVYKKRGYRDSCMAEHEEAFEKDMALNDELLDPNQ